MHFGGLVAVVFIYGSRGGNAEATPFGLRRHSGACILGPVPAHRRLVCGGAGLHLLAFPWPGLLEFRVGVGFEKGRNQLDDVPPPI